MERKNDSTILLLVAAGFGIYWFMKNKSMPPATTAPVNVPIDQTIISTQPVYQQPVQTAPVIEMPVQSAVTIEYTPVMDMMNTITTGGGLQNNANENIVPIDNINLSPKSALSDQYL
jgi:hypothetical protein